ncbi:MAG: caspase family protein [Elusimicrobia bacterium]|nr:caspase family protein [Elusimicrobiota bacterium]
MTDSLIRLALAAALLGGIGQPVLAAGLQDLGMKLETTIKEYFPRRYSIAFLPDGRLAVTEQSQITVYDLAKGAVPQHRFQLNDMYKMAHAPVGSYLAATDGGSTISIWDSTTGQLVREVQRKTFNFTGITFTPDGESVIFYGQDTSKWVLLNIASGSMTDLPISGTGEAVTVSPDGKLLALGASTVYVYELASGKTVWEHNWPSSGSGSGGADSVAFTQDGTLFVAGNYYGNLTVVDTKTWKIKHETLKAHTERINTLAIAPDNSWLVTSGTYGDHAVRVWDLANAKVLAETREYAGTVTGGAHQAAFSPDGRKLALAIYSGYRVEIWDTGRTMSGGRSGVVYIKKAGTPLKSSTGRLVTMLPMATEVTVTMSKGTLLFVSAGKALKGWISAEDVTRVKPDLVGPSIRIIGKSFDDPVLKLKGAVYDDQKVVSLRFGDAGGTNVQRASFAVEKGNFEDVFPFELEVTLTPGLKPVLTAADRGGNQAVVSLNIEEPVEDYTPGLSRLRLLRPESIRQKPAPDAPVVLSVKRGAELQAVGRKAGWYILEGGGWLPGSAAQEVSAQTAPSGPRQVAVRTSDEAKPVLLDEGVDVPPDSAAPLDPAAVAVVVGIEKYRDIPGVEHAARDARAVHAYLTRSMGFDPRNVALLTDERATKNDIAKHFDKWLRNRVTAESRVFVFYAGHGAPKPSTGEAFIVPFDGDPNYVEETAYPLTKLYATLAKLPAREVNVVLDACFSGAGGRSVIAKGSRPLVFEAKPEEVGDKTLLLAAASGAQVSTFHAEAGHGLLTYFFLKGLKGEADADKDKAVTAGELFDYVRPHVEREAQRNNVEQTPMLRGGGDGGKAELGRVWMRLK